MHKQVRLFCLMVAAFLVISACDHTQQKNSDDPSMPDEPIKKPSTQNHDQKPPRVFNFRVATYNVLSDSFKRDFLYTKSLKDWGDCAPNTRCNDVKWVLEKSDADVIALQEIPKSAYDLLLAHMPGYLGKHVERIGVNDGVAVLWRDKIFSSTKNDIDGNPTLNEKYWTGSTHDLKPAMIVFLASQENPTTVLGVTSAHFGSSFHAKGSRDVAGLTKMEDILSVLDGAKTSLNIILGDFNEDQTYAGNFSKIALAKNSGYESGAKDKNNADDHTLSETLTDPRITHELWPPRRAITKIISHRLLDWGFFKAIVPMTLTTERVHGEFDQYDVSFAADLATIHRGENVLGASDHLPVVFSVNIKDAE